MFAPIGSNVRHRALPSTGRSGSTASRARRSAGSSVSGSPRARISNPIPGHTHACTGRTPRRRDHPRSDSDACRRRHRSRRSVMGRRESGPCLRRAEHGDRLANRVRVRPDALCQSLVDDDAIGCSSNVGRGKPPPPQEPAVHDAEIARIRSCRAPRRTRPPGSATGNDVFRDDVTAAERRVVRDGLLDSRYRGCGVPQPSVHRGGLVRLVVLRCRRRNQNDARCRGSKPRSTSLNRRKLWIRSPRPPGA